MIPLRDHNPSSRSPYLTYTLIGINVLVFLFMMSLGEGELEEFIRIFALVPAEVVKGLNIQALFTSMFLHGSIGHIFGNMMFLNIFGDNLEDRLGRIKYILFYLVAGLGASALQIFIDPASTIPNLGASGAIAGLMGGYLVLFPKHKVDILLPFGGFLSTATVPAYTMLFYWILAQFLYGFGGLFIAAQGGVAYFAHIGGFITGGAIIYPFKNLLLRRQL